MFNEIQSQQAHQQQRRQQLELPDSVGKSALEMKSKQERERESERERERERHCLFIFIGSVRPNRRRGKVRRYAAARRAETPMNIKTISPFLRRFLSQCCWSLPKPFAAVRSVLREPKKLRNFRPNRSRSFEISGEEWFSSASESCQLSENEESRKRHRRRQRDGHR